MLYDIAASLHHLHSRRMIHRDLKPGNLLVARTEDRDIVKLADFGLARNYLKNSTMTVGIGTWQYSSPEFFTNSKLTAKSDVYSFGVVMWEMCTRQQPHHDTHFREVTASSHCIYSFWLVRSMSAFPKEMIIVCLFQMKWTPF